MSKKYKFTPPLEYCSGKVKRNAYSLCAKNYMFCRRGKSMNKGPGVPFKSWLFRRMTGTDPSQDKNTDL